MMHGEQGGGGSLQRSQRAMSSSGPPPPPAMDSTQAASMDDTDAVLDGQATLEGTLATGSERMADSHTIPGHRKTPSASVRGPVSRFEEQPPRNTATPVSRMTSPRSTCKPGDDRSSSHRLSSHSLDHHAQQRPIDPPVTKSTLSELDVAKIIQNPKLRHDINFDPDLHFRPNLDGDKGRRKQEKAHLFWHTLAEELTLFVNDQAAFQQRCGGPSSTWSLPLWLKAVKEIIATLVPQRDRQSLEDGFKVEFLMQQFYRGVLDLEKLAGWLSGVLKSHCAPMRDEWVDTMYTQLSQGNAAANIGLLVLGMRSLLGVLEAMKLDVANHQIRCLRPVLIDDTTSFEQKFFYKKIASGKMNVAEAGLWYQNLVSGFGPDRRVREFGDMGAFFDGLTRAMLPSRACEAMPATFLFDEERIAKLRADVMDVINLEILMGIYHDSLRSPISTAAANGGSDHHCARHSEVLSLQLDADAKLTNSRPSSIASLALSASSTDSARSSLIEPPYLRSEHLDQDSKDHDLCRAIGAILQGAGPVAGQANRWRTAAPDIALEIHRRVNYPPEFLPRFEETVIRRVCNVDGPQYRQVEEEFLARFMAAVGKKVRLFKGLSPVALFQKASQNRSASDSLFCSPSFLLSSGLAQGLRQPSQDGGLEDLATRVAHLGCLHWKTWSQLAYLPFNDQEES